MKAIRNHLKLVALILVIPILFQSCTIYKTADVSLHDVSQSDLKVRITTTYGGEEDFEKIYLSDDGQYYGKKYVRSDKKVFIDPNTVEKIKLEDVKKSRIANITGLLVLLGITAGTIIYAFDNMNFTMN